MDLDWVCARTYSAIFFILRSIFLLSGRLLATMAEKVPVLLCLAQQMTTMMKCLCACYSCSSVSTIWDFVPALRPFGRTWTCLSNRQMRRYKCGRSKLSYRYVNSVNKGKSKDSYTWYNVTFIWNSYTATTVSVQHAGRYATVIAVIGLYDVCVDATGRTWFTGM